MTPVEILLAAAALVRKSWNQNDYVKVQEGGTIAMCIIGSIAKVSDDSLTEASGGMAWECVAHKVMQSHEPMRAALEAEARARLVDLSEKWQRKLSWMNGLSKPAERTGMLVCLANISKVKDKEDAASFLESAAQRLMS